MTNFVSYLRVSTDKQGQSGLGMEAQRRSVDDFIAAKEAVLLCEFLEVESGRKNDRPKLAEALDYCRKNKATLLIARLDRLARKVSFISRLMESGVKFQVADMPNASDFMLHIYAAVAQEERRLISQRTKDALKAAKARGVKLGENGKILAQQNKQKAALHARSLSSIVEDIKQQGHHSTRQITDELNNRQIPSPNNGKWHPSSVHKLLKRIEIQN